MTAPVQSWSEAKLTLRGRILWRIARQLGHEATEEKVRALAQRHDDANVIREIERANSGATGWFASLFRFRR